MEEQFFQCPHCWEEISILVDVSVSNQSFIEDCEVCCNPIQFTIQAQAREIVSFQADSIEQ
jgi:transcription elongation factor Elf1